MGNLYRFLRVLEHEGLVRSEWDDEAPGPSKRIYELTDEGRALLGQWAEALRDAQERIERFPEKNAERRGPRASQTTSTSRLRPPRHRPRVVRPREGSRAAGG